MKHVLSIVLALIGTFGIWVANNTEIPVYADETIIPTPVGAGIECAKQVRAQYTWSGEEAVPVKNVDGRTGFIVTNHGAQMRALQENRCYIAMIEIGLREGWYQHSQPLILFGDSRTSYQRLVDFDAWLVAEIAAGDGGWYKFDPRGEQVCVTGFGCFYAGVNMVERGSTLENNLRAEGWLLP